MTTIANAVGTTTEGGFGRPAMLLTAPVGYNTKLFKGGLWLLQPQGTLTLGTGNAALLVVAKASGKTVEVQQQGGNSTPIAHTYVGGALVIQLGTNGGGAGNSTPIAVAAYLKAQAAVMADFADFLPQGTGGGTMLAAAAAPVATKNSWVPGSAVPANAVGAARGEEDLDNTGGLPAVKYASAAQGIHKWQNDIAGTPVTSVLQTCYGLDDNTVSGSSNSSARSKTGIAVGFHEDGGVFVDEQR